MPPIPLKHAESRFEVDRICDRLDRALDWEDRRKILSRYNLSTLLMVHSVYAKQCGYWPTGKKIRNQVFNEIRKRRGQHVIPMGESVELQRQRVLAENLKVISKRASSPTIPVYQKKKRAKR